MVLIVPASGAFLQGVASTHDRIRLTPPGAIANVAGARLHAFCSGPINAPPVFLEAGMGIVSDAWTRIEDNLSSDHRVCRYDRAGTGHSDPFDGAEDARATARFDVLDGDTRQSFRRPNMIALA